jgi:hypothetical protein
MLPQFSITSALAIVFIVAVDCAAIRSVRTRPDGLVGLAEIILFGTLPMANLLATTITARVQRRGMTFSFLVGFTLVGLSAIGATILGMKPGLIQLEQVLMWSGAARWLPASPDRARLVAFLAIPILLFVFQVLVALAGGWLSSRLLRLGGIVSDAESPPRRLAGAALFSFVILAAVPAIAVEGILRWKIDPMTARSPVGTVSVVDVEVMRGWHVTLEDGSTVLVPNGTRVRIDDDSQPSEFAGIRTPQGEKFGDHRSVQVTLLSGERTGASTWVPRQILRDCY